MSKQNFAQPNRPLSINFTDKTLRRAIYEKRRATGSSAEEGGFTMKRKNILLRPVGALTALAITVVGGAGVYAAANWFGGSAQVASDNSVMVVDLSKCQGDTLPPGIEQNADRSTVQFKIIGSPHISEEALQQRLLADCEWQAIQGVNKNKVGASAMAIGIVKSKDTSNNTLTATISFGGSTFDKTFALESDAQVYDKGSAARFSNLKPGEEVALMYDLKTPVTEGVNPFDQDISLKGIFVTQYDLRDVIAKEKPLYGQPNNIMPLGQYNALQHKK
jgi:hypothetical protein